MTPEIILNLLDQGIAATHRVSATQWLQLTVANEYSPHPYWLIDSNTWGKPVPQHIALELLTQWDRENNLTLKRHRNTCPATRDQIDDLNRSAP